MNKIKAVVFDIDGYARILTNPGKEILSLATTLIEPDLSKVRRLAPEYWKLVDNTIVAMTDIEKELRNKDLASEFIPSNVVILEKIKEVPFEVNVIKEKIVEIKKHIPIYIDKIIEKPTEIIKEITKNIEIPVEKEVIKYIEVPVEVVKQVEVQVEKIVEVVKEVEKEVKVELKTIPQWVFWIIGLESLVITFLLLK